MSPQSLLLIRLVVCLIGLGFCTIGTTAFGALEVRLDSPFAEEVMSSSDSEPLPLSMHSDEGSGAGTPEWSIAGGTGLNAAIDSQSSLIICVVCKWVGDFYRDGPEIQHVLPITHVPRRCS